MVTTCFFRCGTEGSGMSQCIIITPPMVGRSTDNIDVLIKLTCWLMCGQWETQKVGALSITVTEMLILNDDLSNHRESAC